MIRGILNRTLLKNKIYKEKYEVIENADAKYKNSKVYYRIYREAQWEGLMSYMNNFLWFIKYAYDRGYIPVVDMQTKMNTYISSEELNHVNGYSKFFIQPANVDVDDIPENAFVLNNGGAISPDRYLKKNSFYVKNKWKGSFGKYISCRPDILNDINSEWRKLVSDNDITLGVNIRGTDYINTKIIGLPIQPSINDIINQIKNWDKKYKITKIFVCCDNAEDIEELKGIFGEKIVINKRKFYPKSNAENLGNPKLTFDRENDNFLKGFEYLTSIVMLSKCDYLIGGASGASLTAQLMRNKKDYFKRIFIFYLGHVK